MFHPLKEPEVFIENDLEIQFHYLPPLAPSSCNRQDRLDNAAVKWLQNHSGLMHTRLFLTDTKIAVCGTSLHRGLRSPSVRWPRSWLYWSQHTFLTLASLRDSHVLWVTPFSLLQPESHMSLIHRFHCPQLITWSCVATGGLENPNCIIPRREEYETEFVNT